MSTRIDGAACQIIPDDLYTSGEPSLNNLAAAAGDRFDVWQRQINRIILAKSADGFWSARNAVLSIPRQTGKTYDIGWVAIHRAARTPACASYGPPSTSASSRTRSKACAPSCSDRK
jgi:hypothetical protein